MIINIKRRIRLKKIILLMFFTSTLFHLSSCSSDSSKNVSKDESSIESKDDSEADAPTAEKKAPESENLEEARTLRTAEEYVAAIAKTLNLTKSKVKEETNFAEAQSSLPKSSEVNEANVNDIGLIKAIEIAAKACTFYLAQDAQKNKDLDTVAEELLSRAVPTEEQAKDILEAANRIAEKNEKDDKLHTTCSAILAFSSITY